MTASAPDGAAGTPPLTGLRRLQAGLLTAGLTLALLLPALYLQLQSDSAKRAATPPASCSDAFFNALAPLGMALFVAVVRLDLWERRFSDAFGLPPCRNPRLAFLAALLLGMLLCPLFFAASGPLQTLFENLFGVADSVQHAVAALTTPSENPWPQRVSALCAFTLIPFGEELTFRALIYGGLRAGSVPGAAVLSALFFAFAHLDILRFLPLFVLGLLFCLAWRKGGLFASFGLHAGFNLANLLLILLFPEPIG